ncbi:MAG: TlpA family protein disulfide reductase [Chloroflexi bacterium]|nr:TlpA family protein disulfide reductase [Chloroflexota bacterium]
MPAVADLHREKLRAAGVHVIGVSQYSTTMADTVAFAERNRLTFPNLYDANAELAAAYDVQALPGYVFLDRQGRISQRSSGARGVGFIESRLNELLAE